MMKYFKLIVIALFLCSINVFSQDNPIKHTVVKGETISSIAQKYNVSITAIYKLNPKAKKTLQLNQVLEIPKSETDITLNSGSSVSEKTIEVTHEVLPKETLYGITKQFKTSTELLYKANPKLESEGLKIGQKIIIPSGLSKKEISSLSNSAMQETVEKVETVVPLTHEVKPKESLYAIAKMYSISLKELQEANPSIGKKGLGVGQIVQIPSNGKMPENEVVVEDKKIEIKEIPVAVKENKETVPAKEVVPAMVEKVTKTDEEKVMPQTPTSEIIHEVLTKETKYGIAKKYGITVAELEQQNPAIRQKLLVGSKLSIQVSSDKIEEVNNDKKIETKEETPKEIVYATVVKDTASTFGSIANADLIDKIIQSASEKIGVRYRTGGTTTDGFDCSGLIYTTFGAFDVKLPRSSIEQSSIGEKVNDTEAQKGDLIFFKTNGRRQINHVGMVIEVVDDEIKFIHSSTHSGVIISSTKEPYYQRNFAQVNRVIK